MRKFISRTVIVLLAIAAIPAWEWLGGSAWPENLVALFAIIPISLIIGVIVYMLNVPRDWRKRILPWLLTLSLILTATLYACGITLPFWPQLLPWSGIMVAAGFSWAAMDVNDAHCDSIAPYERSLEEEL